MDRILRGIMKYRATDRKTMVEQFQRVRDNPEPKAVFFTCMDSRMIPTRFTETNIGDMFVVRNAGNVIPNSQNFPEEVTTTEPAALELGCVINDIRHVIVCGHSDCKQRILQSAMFPCCVQDSWQSCTMLDSDIRDTQTCQLNAMNLLHRLKCEEFSSRDNRLISPLRAWLIAHANASLKKFEKLETGGFHQPLLFQAETPMRKFVAYIDPDNKFSIEDKLSQVNCLQQLQNIASYGFLKKRLETHQLHIHALWFDIYTGDIYYFSRQNKRFVEINEHTVMGLIKEVNRYYS
ncbi:beta carbonic anhydrase 1 isoform X1 [Schistocerca piceifrons]|uniref:beta carbonic anhydrase 1 isoform X1 n=1 Tax=Schistocerca piceifrons TaxID=274613 RepID=UPI001F5F296A|nr:beta carbonic anhydrase 1 isoform X1 [Schistocerca piceifrons]